MSQSPRPSSSRRSWTKTNSFSSPTSAAVRPISRSSGWAHRIGTCRTGQGISSATAASVPSAALSRYPGIEPDDGHAPPRQGHDDPSGRDLPAWPFVDLAIAPHSHDRRAEKPYGPAQLQVETGGSPLFERYIQVVRDQSGHLIAKRTEDAKIQLSGKSEATID